MIGCAGADCSDAADDGGAGGGAGGGAWQPDVKSVFLSSAPSDVPSIRGPWRLWRSVSARSPLLTDAGEDLKGLSLRLPVNPIVTFE